jgi:ATP-dependent Clp protease adaptor protein ClpS
MSDLSDSAVLEPKKKKQARPQDDKPKPQPPYAVIVLNDDLHTFPYVIETFQKVFGFPAEKGHQLAEQIHTRGETIVWSGTRELAELKQEQIRSAGTDYYAKPPVKFPLGVRVEPLPG